MADSVWIVHEGGEEEIGPVEDIQSLPGHDRDGEKVDPGLRFISRLIDETIAAAVEEILYGDTPFQNEGYPITIEIR